MKRRTMLLLGPFALALVSGDLAAQARRETQPRKPVRVGIIAPSPAPEPIVVSTTGFPMGNTTGGQIPNSTGLHNNFVAPSLVQVSYFPTVTLSDGRVLANFGTGRGYEQVLRKCPTFSGAVPHDAYVAPCWTVDGSGKYLVVQQR